MRDIVVPTYSFPFPHSDITLLDSDLFLLAHRNKRNGLPRGQLKLHGLITPLLRHMITETRWVRGGGGGEGAAKRGEGLVEGYKSLKDTWGSFKVINFLHPTQFVCLFLARAHICEKENEEEEEVICTNV